MNYLTITDQSFSGAVHNSIDITITTPTISLEKIIIERVKTEVRKYNDNLTSVYQGLITPKHRLKKDYTFSGKTTRIDEEKQIYVALHGFVEQSYFVIINDEQVVDLNKTFLVNEIKSVAFIKLTPLIGG